MSDVTYPPELAIQPLAKLVNATVTVPGSKSITNRALVLAALGSCNTSCTLTGVLRSEDTEVMVDCLQRLGFDVRPEWPVVRVFRHDAPPFVPAKSANLFVANSGTTVRFLTALCAIGCGRYRLDGVPRMRERPIEDLLAALRQLGVNAYSEAGNGCPPVVIESDHFLPGGVVSIRADVSSQFLSGLLLVAPIQRDESLTIRVEGQRVSEPYIAMTEEMLRQWVIPFDRREAESGREYVFESGAGTSYGVLTDYAIEPDASAASYFWAAAAVAGGRVTVSGLNRTSLQGDVRFVDVLAQMGCRVEECDAGITVHGGPLRGIDVDMNDISDTVMTLGAVALFADGPTAIRNVGHIRHKETDRIAALATELRKLGAEVEERPDGLTIHPRPLTGVAVETYNDHRMAMSLALVGLRVPGVIIRNPGCVAKTYPSFWQDFAALRG
ncbi:MAG: 3-phosphoshikimate 1-carboxyvinyltransferase [Gemmataceae bacterium]|nr:3-phosphoshikimate 1-carboxyvinyltransferase [Gemmataceae bacterium]